jgi:hypothetical protein
VKPGFKADTSRVCYFASESLAHWRSATASARWQQCVIVNYVLTNEEWAVFNVNY